MLAYTNHFGSIEADIWIVDGKLYVAHDSTEIRHDKTLETMYILPVVNAFRQNRGKAWADREGGFQLLIDLKSETYSTLSALLNMIKQYRGVFDPGMNKNAVRIVITGNVPSPGEYIKYPRYISFDGDISTRYDRKQLKKIALFSENFKKFTHWNGIGIFPEDEQIRLKQTVDSIHRIQKKIRFWDAPDNPESWEMLMKLGVDYINTDRIVELSGYLNRRKNP